MGVDYALTLVKIIKNYIKSSMVILTEKSGSASPSIFISAKINPTFSQISNAGTIQT